MCNDHEHHTNYSTNNYINLCFRHATLEAIAGHHVETETVTYEQRTECEVCDKVEEDKYFDSHVLTKKDHITGVSVPVEMETIYADCFEIGLATKPEDIKKVLLKGYPVTTNAYIYQYTKI